MPTEIKTTLFLKKLDFSLIKHGFYPINHPFLVKAIFIANRKGLLRYWKTLMTDNDLDLNDRKMLLKARKSGSDGTFHPFRRQK